MARTFQSRLLPAPTFPLGRRSPNTHRKQWPVGHCPGNSRSRRRSWRWNSRAEAGKPLTPSLATWLREIGVKSENTKLNSCPTKPLLLWLQVFPTLLEEIGARRKECVALGNLPKFQQDPSLLGCSGEHLHWKHCDSKSCNLLREKLVSKVNEAFVAQDCQPACYCPGETGWKSQTKNWWNR